MPESEEESVSDSEEEYSSEESSGNGEYSSSSVSGESDASDSLKERRDSHGRASVSAKQLKNMITNKAFLQDGEVIDPRVPSKFPRKPMVELKACSNVWYQGSIIKESANEVKIVYTVPNGQGRCKPRVEWIRKASARIWRGSYKAHDWRHLGQGAWEPRASRGKNSRSKRGGGGGGGSRARKQPPKHRSRKDSRDSDSDCDAADGGETSAERPKSRSHPRGTSQPRQQSSREGPEPGGQQDPGGKGSDRGAVEGSRAGGRDSAGGPLPAPQGPGNRGRGSRQIVQASPSHPLTGGGGKAGDDEVMSPRPSALYGVAGGGCSGEAGGYDGSAEDALGEGGKAGTSGWKRHCDARGGGRQLHRSPGKGVSGAVAAGTATADVGTATTALPELPQSQPPRERPSQRRHPPPVAADVPEVDEQASEHSPDDVAESPGGFLCDQASTRCSPSDEDAPDGRVGGACGPVPDPTYDPLARWFVAHYSQLQAAGTLGLLPGGLYECGRLPAGFIVDPATALIAPDGLIRTADGGGVVGSGASSQQPQGPTVAGPGSAGVTLQFAPVGRSAAASPVPCTGLGGGGGATGSPAPADYTTQSQHHPYGTAGGHRLSGDGSGLPGSTRGGGGGGSSAPGQRHLSKQTSGVSSNGQREPRDGASVSPAGGGGSGGPAGKRLGDAGPVGLHDAAAAGGGHGTAGGSLPLKKFKRAIIITESEDDEGDPQLALPSLPPLPGQMLTTAAPQAHGGDAPNPAPGSGGTGKCAGTGGGGGVAVHTHRSTAVANANANGNSGHSMAATGIKQEPPASYQRASAASVNPGGTSGRSAVAGSELGATVSAGAPGSGGAANPMAARPISATAVAVADPPAAASGSGRAAGASGGGSGGMGGNRGGSGLVSGGITLRNGSSATAIFVGVGGGVLGRGEGGGGRKELASAPRPRAITTMDLDL